MKRLPVATIYVAWVFCAGPMGDCRTADTAPPCCLSIGEAVQVIEAGAVADVGTPGNALEVLEWDADGRAVLCSRGPGWLIVHGAFPISQLRKVSAER